jgi:4-hydroxythreonine-4-phosphate dehydrogenase
MGDPAGIGPEIIVKALAQQGIWRVCRPIVVGSLPIMKRTASALKTPLKPLTINGHDVSEEKTVFKRGALPIFDPFDHPLKPVRRGEPSLNSGMAAVQCIETAVEWARMGYARGIVTAPINKKAIQLAGYSYPGHTEMLGSLTGSKEVGMMILGGPLKILFATTHVAIRNLSSAITKDRVLRAIRLAHSGLRRYFGLRHPRIGVAGLNPHAGESGLFGQEEINVIAPAIQQARASRIRCSGPHPADTLFGKAMRGEFDGIVAMYHDQGLVALKTVAFGKCVNLTVGLPFIRTSVDHGTAYDIVGKLKADPSSLIEAITLAARLAV